MIRLALLFCLLTSSSLTFAKDRYVMASLGDSVSMAFKLSFDFNRPEHSWSTGNEGKAQIVESHLMKLKRLYKDKKEVIGINVSVSGSRSGNLKRQVKRLLKKSAKPDYVTLLSGANDVCSWFTRIDKKQKRYKSNMENAVKSLISANENVKILLVPIPHLVSLWEVGKDRKWCRFIWRAVPFCSALFGLTRNEDKRDIFMSRVEKMNNSLQEIADIYPKNISFNKALSFIELSKDMISRNDCFHPNLKGQKVISEYTWEPEFILGRELEEGEDDGYSLEEDI